MPVGSLDDVDVIGWLLDGDPPFGPRLLPRRGSGAGAAPDPRMAEAVALVRSKQQPDRCWLLDRIHPGRVHFDMEGGVGTLSRWNTPRALRVLRWWDEATATGS